MLLVEAELSVTEALVREFIAPGGVGERLQEILEARAQTHDNYLEEYWFNFAYMDNRLPLVINSNTGMTYDVKHVTSIEEQLEAAASYIIAALDYKQMLDEYKIPQEKFGSVMLDMSSYYNIFGTCRIPGEKRDTIRRFYQGEYASHIAVVHNYHFFKVVVYDEDGKRLNKRQLTEQLRTVIAESPEQSKSPVGILTSEQRDTWYRMRQELLKDSQNRESLEMIETSLVVLSLDAEPSESNRAAKSSNEEAALRMIHGGGLNSPNRWFDKAMNFVVGWYGAMGVGCEHSPADGNSLTPLFGYIGDQFDKEDTHPDVANISPPQKLGFNITDEIHESIEAAKKNLQKQIDNFEMKCYMFTHFGADFIKSEKLSPDSFMQMAIQLAFYRLHGTPAAQYESGTLRRFYHGRTETIRSCSEQSVNFCKIMLDPSASNEDKAKAMKDAITLHKILALYSVSGEGIDRHLMALRSAAVELGLDVPQIFLDPGFTRSTYFRLSTSQLVMRNAAFFLFGPVVPDGYGVCYFPHPNKISFGISAFKNCPEISASKLAAALENSFLDMQRVLMKLKEEKK